MKKEFSQNTKIITIVVSVILVAFSLWSKWNTDIFPRFIREAFLAGSLFLLLPVILKSKKLLASRLTDKLKNILILVLGLYLAFFISAFLIKSSPFTFRFTQESNYLLNVTTGLQHFVIGSLSYLAGIFLIVISVSLYQLTLYRRKKWPSNLLKAALVSGSITLFLSFIRNKPVAVEIFVHNGNTETIIFYVITVFFLFLISFKNSWVNYLNKRQKLVSLLSLLVTGPLIFGLDFINLQNIINSFSLIIGGAFFIVINFLELYVVLAFLSILLHLPTAGIFDRKVRQLGFLQNISRKLGSVQDKDVLKRMIIEFSSEIIESDLVWYQERDSEKNEYRLAASSAKVEDNTFLINLDPGYEMNKVISKTREPYVLNGFSKSTGDAKTDKYKRLRGSLIGIPLVSQNLDVMGILYSFKGTEFAFDNEDIEVLKAFANQIVTTLDNIQLQEEAIEKERLKQELKVAREVQLKLLPKDIPALNGKAEIDAYSLPAHEVGGDYYDFVKISDHKLGVIIGDVSGKGTSAAFYMAEIKGIVQSLVSLYDSPREFLIQINKTLYDNIDKRSFITLSYAIFDTEKMTVRFARAGHSPLLVFRKNKEETEVITNLPKGIGLGLDRGNLFNIIIEEKTFEYKSGDVFLFYTDGATDAFNADGNEFSEENVIESIKENISLPPDLLRKSLMTDIKIFAKNGMVGDDITLIVIKIPHEMISLVQDEE